MRTACELVSTGAELLNGRTLNRHAQTLGSELEQFGLELVRDTTVPDQMESIEEAVRGALSRVDLVIVSGGLGPTSDDVTRNAVGKIFGAKLVMDEATRQKIVERYARTGKPMNQAVELHAMVLDGATVLQNSAGLAPGERIERDGKTVFLLPGPPHEFHAVLSEQVMPWIAAHPEFKTLWETRVFQVCGIGESDIVSILEPKGFPGDGVEVAYCAAPGRVEVRLRAPPRLADAVERATALVRERLGPHVFAEERVDLEVVVGRMLAKRNATLSTAESCTGGLIGHRITNVPGSSVYFLGGVLAYANESKARELGVSERSLAQHGAVSKEVAQQMAEGVRARFGSDYGLGVTGIAGPSGGTPEKPVGWVCFAVADARGCVAREQRFNGAREIVKAWSAQMSLDLLRRRLAGIV